MKNKKVKQKIQSVNRLFQEMLILMKSVELFGTNIFKNNVKPEYIVIEAGANENEAPFIQVIGKYDDIVHAQNAFIDVFANKLNVNLEEIGGFETFRSQYPITMRRREYWSYNPLYILKIIEL